MEARVFSARARELRAIRELVKGEASAASATALLAVHSALALNDALLVVWRGKPVKGTNHREAVRATMQQAAARQVETSGIHQLSLLVSRKSEISYGDQPVTHQTALALAIASSRFEAWTYKSCKELAHGNHR